MQVDLAFSVVKLATDEVLRIEDGVDGVHRGLVLRGVTDETLGVGEGDIGRGGAFIMVVGDDLDTVVLPGVVRRCVGLRMLE